MAERKRKGRRGRKKAEKVITKVIVKQESDQPKRKRGRPRKNKDLDSFLVVPTDAVAVPVPVNDSIEIEPLNQARLFNFQKRKTMCSTILAKYCADVKSTLRSDSFSSLEISNIHATIKNIDSFLQNWNSFTLQVVDVLKENTDKLIKRTVNECTNLIPQKPGLL